MNMSELRYLTADTSKLIKTTGLGSQRDVYLNGSPEKFLLLRTPTKEEWSKLRKEIILSITLRRMQEMESAKDSRTLRAFSLQNLRDSLRFDYLKHRWFCKKVTEFPSDARGDPRHTAYLAQLTLGEQRELWERIRPRTYEEAVEATQAHVLSKHDGLHLEAALETDDVAERINLLISMLGYVTIHGAYRGKPGGDLIYGSEFKQTIHLILSQLWRRDILLYSLPFSELIRKEAAESTGKAIRPGYLLKVTNNPMMFDLDIVRVATAHRADVGRSARTQEHSTGSLIPWFLLSTTVRDIGDISPELLTATRSMGLKSYTWWHDVRRAYESKYGAATFPQPPLSSRSHAPRTRSLKWVLERDPSLTEWTALYEEAIGASYKTYKSSEYVNSRFFFRWLLSLEHPRPSPENLSKFDIRDERPIPASRKSFRAFLDESKSETTATLGEPIRSTTKAMSVNQLRTVMEHLRQKNLAMIQADSTLIGRLRVDNPVSPQDSIWKSHTPKRTHRSAIGADVIELCKGIVLEPDEVGKPTFRWVMAVREFRLDWIIIDKQHSGRWPYERPYDEKSVQVWQPTRALALYTMLEIPLRSFQVRWLDSGAGDEYIWDISEGRLVPNVDEKAEPGRQEGVFQPVSDSLDGAEDCVGLYVTTNKTQQWNPEVNQGFLVPWPNESFYQVLDLQRQWCSFISTVVHTQPVKLSDDDFNVQEKLKDLLPSYHVLFQDASRLTSLTRPISRSKIDAAWSAVCLEAQNRLKTRNVHLRLVKSKNEQIRGDVRAVHDLHSLRVTGITNLFLKGVPVEIISRYIAGHASIAMTLHYESSNPIEIRRRLQRWVSDAKPSNSDEKVEALLHFLDSDRPISPQALREVFGEGALERLFITNEFGGGSSAAYSAMAEGTGLWAWYGDGICPGTRCAEGDESGGPVKGGPRSCGNCRYFLTGVAFIYGQAHKCNQLMYELRALGVEREKCLREKRNHAQFGQKHRELQSRTEELDALIEPKLSDWWGRYRLLLKSIQAAAEGGEGKRAHGNSGGGLVATSEAGISISVERSNQFRLLKELCLSAEMLGLANDANAPVLEIRAMINVILSKHGVEPFLIGVPDAGERRLTNLVAQALEDLFRAHYACSTASAYERMQAIACNIDSSSDPILASSLQQLAATFRSIEADGNLLSGVLALPSTPLKQIEK